MTKGKMIKGITLGDIHFGIKDSKRLYDELSLFKQVLKDGDFDLLVFTGDYFQKQLTLSDSASFYALTFFTEVIQICEDKGIVVRMIEGTASHERNQLLVLNPYVPESVDFKIYYTVTEEEVFPGYKCLFIPEEYLDNSDEYYDEYKGKEYSSIFGHGTWDFVAHLSQMEHSAQTKSKSAPVFIFKEWRNAVKDGFIIFGHIHGRNVYTNKIYYPGSYSRWNYSERSVKGFTTFEYDVDNKKYKVELVDNTLAPKYEVLDLSDLKIDLEEIELDALYQILKETVEDSDNIKINITALSKDRQLLFKKLYENTPNVRIEVTRKGKNLTESKDYENLKLKFEKYEYIIKQQLPLEETIQRFAKEDLDSELTLDIIKEVLT